MTALLALLAVATGPRVVEVPSLTSDRIAIQIVVRLPELDARELAMAGLLEDVVLDGTTEFTKTQLVGMTNSVGQPIRCRLMPDCLRIQYSMPKGSLQTAGVVANSVCRFSSLSADSLSTSLATLPFKNRDYWSEALEPRIAKYDRIRLADFKEFYKHLFRPENIIIGVAGAFGKGEAESQMAASFVGWFPEKDTYPAYHFTDLPKSQETRKRPITTVEMYSEVMASDVGKNALMGSVLGLGKGSVVFRIIREKLYLSYRQEAFLWPSESGIQLRLIAVVTDPKSAKEALALLRPEVIKAIDALDETDLERAKALLRSAWQNGLIGGPVYDEGGRPVGQSVEDKAFLAAYGLMKTGAPWSLESMLQKAEDVKLDDLKLTLKAIIENAKIKTISSN